MSFLKKLFGGGGGQGEIDGGEPVEHKGFLIRATPYKEDGQYQTCGVVTKEVDGELKEHRFVRADKTTSVEDAIAISLRKGRQIVDEQGDAIFR
ncbi:MAG: hypothetical protein JJ913_10270 [Rhizobiaceae bacterium]|nr:hypothetical protein [Rhizobiaceae bacterium]